MTNTSVSRRQLLFGGVALAATIPTLSWAGNGTCPSVDPCVFEVKPGHKTNGSIKMALTQWVNVCHPDEHVAVWWSLVKTTTDGYMDLVRRVMADPSKSLADEVELAAGQCSQQFYADGWRILITSDCRIEGKTVFLLSQVLTAADHKRTLGPDDWSQLPYEF